MMVHIPGYMYTRGMKFEQRRNDEVFESITRQIWTLENFTVTQQAHPIILCIHLEAPILFSFRLPVCNAHPIYIYIYISYNQKYWWKEYLVVCGILGY